MWLAAKWTVIGWTVAGLLAVVYFGYTIEVDERTNPTPDEWRFETRHALRAARYFRDPDNEVIVEWAKVGRSYLKVLKRLEDGEKEGKGLQRPLEMADGEEATLPGLDRNGFDITGKSWPWRAGYFEVVMGCATAAEHLDSMVLDTSRRMVFPREVMIGPSNPDPRPTPPYMNEAPLEENCVAPYAAPETFYMRVLTGRGFTTRQKLDAALAYANWLEFKGMRDAARDMYKWGIDIATAALPSGTQPAHVLDTTTSTLKENASDITPNLLRATTSLAIHHARSGNISASLPIFLSVLRARRTAPVSPFPEPVPSKTDFSLWNFLFVPPKFPDPPPSGDIPIIRESTEPTCLEAELMLYIGEIIFASSKQSLLEKHTAEEGLAWTKQAVTIADAQLAKPKLASAHGKEMEAEAKKCKECLMTGVGNWEVMLRHLAQQVEPETKTGSWKFWQKGSSTDEHRQSRLEKDQRKVEELRERIIQDGLRDQVIKANSQTGLWFGN